MTTAFREWRRAWDTFVAALARTPQVEWLATGNNVFYGFAVVVGLGGAVALIEGRLLLTGLMALGWFVSLLFAGFGQPR